MVRLVRAEYRGDHRVSLEFSDGIAAEIDLANELWGEVFEPLKAPEVFASFRVDGTLVWDCGADLAPEFLYELASRIARRAS
jgi:Protein of unknown function (DUF2442)